MSLNQFFPEVENIAFEGPSSTNPLSYRYYDPSRVVMGKTMEEHLRLGVCYWHNFCWDGTDPFGTNSMLPTWDARKADPMAHMRDRADAIFEVMNKLNVPFFTFHDIDIAPQSEDLKTAESNLMTMVEYLQNLMSQTGKKVLWGTANTFAHRRYMAGAFTNPNPEVFAFAARQVKHALDATHQLQGENYVLWGGREGYDTLLNTDMKRETDNMARFLHMLVDYKHKIGFKGTLLIEPKPCEPTKHQYDFDTATVLAFLNKHGLEKEFRVNIEGNHATLAGHSFDHEVDYAYANNLFGSIDANMGDPELGWDLDQFPTDVTAMTRMMVSFLNNGGFETGGFNFDTKRRRQSIDGSDLFMGHISGIDNLAYSLLAAEHIIAKGEMNQMKADRYAGWNDTLGQAIENKQYDLEALSALVESQGISPKPTSGQQEYFEAMLNLGIYQGVNNQ